MKYPSPLYSGPPIPLDFGDSSFDSDGSPDKMSRYDTTFDYHLATGIIIDIIDCIRWIKQGWDRNSQWIFLTLYSKANPSLWPNLAPIAF